MSLKDNLILILVALGMLAGGIFGLTIDAGEYDILFMGMQFNAAIPTLLGSILMIAMGGWLLYILIKDLFPKK